MADNVTGLYKSRKSKSLKVLAFFRFDLNEKLTISQLVIEGNNDFVDNCDKRSMGLETSRKLVDKLE